MTPNLPALLALSRRLMGEASPLPWRTVNPGHGRPTEYLCVQLGEDDRYTTLELLPGDARYIEHAVNQLPAYADALEQMGREVERLKSLIDDFSRTNTEWLAACDEEDKADEAGLLTAELMDAAQSAWDALAVAEDALFAAATPRQPEDPTP